MGTRARVAWERVVSCSCQVGRWGLPLVLFLIAGISTAAAQESASPSFCDYWGESRFLVDVPGASNSLGAGLLNPAAWSMRDRGGLYFAWEDWDEEAVARDWPAGTVDPRNWTAIASLKLATFAVRRYGIDSEGGSRLHGEDYTLALGGGSRASSMGLAYTWNRGRGFLGERHSRLSLGSVTRHRWVSVGGLGIWDLDGDGYLAQMDVGLRPLGPRLTLFADAVWEKGQDFESIRTGYGLELHPLQGLVLGAKALNTGEVAFRLGVGLGGAPQTSVRTSLDNDGNALATTLALESGLPGPRVAIHRGGGEYPTIKLKGPMAYQRYRFFDDRRTLLGTLLHIDRLAQDPGVDGVVVDLSQMQLDAEMTWEVREQLAGLRAAGKKVIVCFDRVGMAGYLLASVADQIWIDPQGEIEIMGLAAGKTYLRAMFDKLGVGVDEWRFFTFKSAFETFSRTSMSDPDREQLQMLIDDFYETIAAAVTAARPIDRAAWDELIDEKGMLLPREALAAGLVDSIGTVEEAKESARDAQRRAGEDPSAARLASVVGDPVWGPMEWGERDRIAVIYGVGECAMDSGIRGPALAKTIKAAREDARVKALVFRADSPGGDPLPSDLVARELRKTAEEKPVIVSQGRVAGSGGYWISMYGDTIVASPLTITGSIGVIGGWLWDSGLGEKLGITFDGVQRGAHADLGQGMHLPLVGTVVPERNLTPEERARMEELIRTMYGEFVAQVAEGRGMTEAAVDAVGQGRIWSGTRGKDQGLVDEIGGLWLALGLARKAAGIPEGRRIEVTQAPHPGAVRLDFLKPKLIDASAGSDPLSELAPQQRAFLERFLHARGRPLPMMEPVWISDGVCDW